MFENLKAGQFSVELLLRSVHVLKCDNKGTSEYKVRMVGPVHADLGILEFVLKQMGSHCRILREKVTLFNLHLGS